MVGRWDLARIDRDRSPNLVSNAVKYGASSGLGYVPAACETHAMPDGHRSRAGHPGQAPRAHLLRRFERANDDARVRGSGLGLWIVRQLVEAHGGVADVISEPGQGATFLVQLPFGQAAVQSS